MTRWHAHPATEPADNARSDLAAVALAIAVLLVLVFLCSWVLPPVPR